MRSDERVYQTISDETGIPGARQTWGPKACTPKFPYFTYERTGGGEFYGDDHNHATLPRYRATLFTEEPDDELEDSFAGAVSKLGPYSRSWEYDDEHEAYTMSCDFTLTRRA